MSCYLKPDLPIPSPLVTATTRCLTTLISELTLHLTTVTFMHVTLLSALVESASFTETEDHSDQAHITSSERALVEP